MLISLKEYADKNGRALSSCRKMALRGSFETAQKIGRDWLIDENEPYPDHRIKSGKYVGWRDKIGKKREEKQD